MKVKEVRKRRKEEKKKMELENENVTETLTIIEDNQDKKSNNKKEEEEEKKKKKKKDKKQKDKQKGKQKGKCAFEKMDNRMTYDKKSKRFINRIVNDVTFGVNMSECLGLLGPNGAGKTTSISMITGLLPITHGLVRYGQNDLRDTDIADLSLGYCSQHDSLWKLLTVKETIEFYLNICGYPCKDISRYTKALMEACGIEIHKNKKVSDISGGTQR